MGLDSHQKQSEQKNLQIPIKGMQNKMTEKTEYKDTLLEVLENISEKKRMKHYLNDRKTAVIKTKWTTGIKEQENGETPDKNPNETPDYEGLMKLPFEEFILSNLGNVDALGKALVRAINHIITQEEFEDEKERKDNLWKSITQEIQKIQSDFTK